MDNRLIVGHALERVASVKGVGAGVAEAGRTTLDLRTVRGASEVPGCLGPSATDSRRAVTHSAQDAPSAPWL